MIRSLGFILSVMIAFAGGLRAAAQEGSSVRKSAPAGLMEAEWKFLKAAGENKNEETAAAILPELEEWLKFYPDGEYAPDAQLLKAGIHLRQGNYKYAIVDLLKLLREYPGSGSAASARKLFADTASKRLSEKNIRILNEISASPEAPDKADRLAALLRQLGEQAGEDFYEPLVAEFRGFFVRFPAYAEGDVLQLVLGDLHMRKREYLSARLAYEKVLLVYPGSKLLVKAKRALGDVLADNLKEYDAAIAVYQEVAAGYPGTEEAWAAYGQLARLSERQKQYALAVDIHEKIIALYPDKTAAYDSFNAEARLLREEMSRPRDAVAVLGRLADKYKGEKAIEALYLAAKIAKKDMKDLDTEVKIYDRIAAEYTQDSQAPKAVFAAAEAYESAMDFDKAKEYYGKVSDLYPQDPLSSKAKKRVNAIISK